MLFHYTRQIPMCSCDNKTKVHVQKPLRPVAYPTHTKWTTSIHKRNKTQIKTSSNYFNVNMSSRSTTSTRIPLAHYHLTNKTTSRSMFNGGIAFLAFVAVRVMCGNCCCCVVLHKQKKIRFYCERVWSLVCLDVCVYRVCMFITQCAQFIVRIEFEAKVTENKAAGSERADGEEHKLTWMRNMRMISIEKTR